MTWAMRAVGDAALIVDCPDLAGAQALYAALRRNRPAAVVDLVPGARTVLVRTQPGADLQAVARAVRAGAAQISEATTPEGHLGEPVLLPVRYDGPDLQEVARHTGLSADEVVTAHTGSTWIVAFIGFAPGFAYLAGGDPRLHVPRRTSPRAQVDAGSVGLAGEYSGIYPRASPGGWQLIGRTDAVLWDAVREPAALLRPGLRVRFQARP